MRLVDAPEIGDSLPVLAERLVQRPVGLQPDNREVSVAYEGPPDDHDLPVRLEGDPTEPRRGPEVDGADPILAEGWVETSADLEPDDRG